MRFNVPAILSSSLLIASSVSCLEPESNGRPGYGLIGYGISMYNPTCAYACEDALTNPVNCTVTDSHDHDHGHKRKRMDHGHSGMSEMPMGDGWMVEKPASPECRATNDAFLQTLAYCIHTYCTDERISALEEYWELNVAGRATVQPLPKISYQEAVQAITDTPPMLANSSVILNSVGIVSEAAWMQEFRTLTTFEKVETAHGTYSIVVIVTGAVIPIVLSFVRFLPIPSSLCSRFEAIFITPPLFGTRHKIPYLYETFTMPTRGQSLFIFYQIAINVILCGVGIESANPSSWFKDVPREVVAYISNRAGALSFANIPLLVLFSSRNNALLWITNWSHGTFLLLHRWIAFIATIEACLHSAIYLENYHVDGLHTSQSQLPYWYWGIIATLAMVVILPASVYSVRQKFYELFLAWHVFFFLLTLIGCFLHIYYRYAWQWGYETWIYIAFAIWGFDRLMRILRVVRHGTRQARVTVIDEDYVKLEIPGVRAEGHVYLYFPTLTWRVWENHPFSVLTDVSGIVTNSSTGSMTSSVGLESSTPASDEDIQIEEKQISFTPPEKSPQTTTTIAALNNANTHIPYQHQQTLTIYLRTQTGITALLPNHANTTVPTLVESSYPPHSLTFSSSTGFKSEHIIAIAGGVGITALATPLLQHQGRHKLFWAVRSRKLVEAVRESLSAERFQRLNASVFVSAEREERMDIRRMLKEEVKGVGKGGKVLVVVCGPAGMSDEVRVATARIAKEVGEIGVEVEFLEEYFGW
ncbi:ferric reductase like transmembrane component-domain-containing protein [Aspergillus karnatakaensis]|uniref:ferric reductase family protein n=1 Tax=Aspergillus karnatakaensis TaxID=1810916 RepID=UPI003CCCC793